MVKANLSAIRVCLGAVLFFLSCLLPAGGQAEPTIPSLTGWVVDNAHVLNPATIAALTRRLEAFEQQTSNQIVVVTLPDLGGYGVEDWGLALLRGWGIGQKDRNNGIVLLVAPNDRQVRIEVGYGLEGALPDATAYTIIQHEMIPHFKNYDVSRGVSAGVEAIISAIGGTYRAKPAASSSEVAKLAAFATLGFLVILFVIWIVRSGRERRWDPDQKKYVWYWPTPDPSTQTMYNRPNNSGGFISGSSSHHSGSSGISFGGGFHGGGGSGGGGGASGRW